MKIKLNMLVALGILGLLCLLGLAGCSTHASKSATYTVDTGDNIKVQVDLKAGYDLKMTVPFEVLRNEETVIFGTFDFAEIYDTYYQLVAEDPNAELLAEGSRDDNEYFFYTVNNTADNEEDKVTEYNYFVRVAGSDTVVIMGSVASREEAEAAFAAITINKAD